MKQVVIMGAGKSVTEGLDKGLWDKLSGREVWSCNSVYKVMPYLPKRQFWVDWEFFNHETQNMQKLHKQGVPLVCKKHHKMAFLQDVTEQYPVTSATAEYYGKEGFQKDKLFITSMGLCGALALSYAIAAGYDEIFLLGYDFGSPALDQKHTHWYQEQIGRLDIMSSGAGRPAVYLLPDGKPNAFLNEWDVYAKTEGVKIWNVSLISNLHQFEKITYDDFFSKIT